LHNGREDSATHPIMAESRGTKSHNQYRGAKFRNQQAADALCVSVKTAETYRARLQEKLGLRTRAELVRYALDHGLLGPNGPSQ